MTTDDRVLAYVRTYVPYAIGSIVAWLAAHTLLDFTGPAQLAATAFAIAIGQNLYYLVIRWAEERMPFLGALLGWPRAPRYTGVSDLWTSVVRTGIPPLVAAAVVSLTAVVADRLGVVVDPSQQTAIVVGGVAVVETVYFAAARWAVLRWPALGVLLGGAVSTPRYPRHAASVPDAPSAASAPAPAPPPASDPVPEPVEGLR